MRSASWPDRTLYPFASHYLDLDVGRLHYVDEGEGPPIVMAHGTPDWSFVYRTVIKRLSASHRCIALDHLGFGLSDKPPTWSYRPEDHAANFTTLVEQLGLKGFTLVVHDFGGPIGLSYAIAHPEQINHLVISNTWLWSLRDDREIARIGRFMGGSIGKLLYLQFNFSTRVVIPFSWGDRSTLSKEVHRQYVAAAPKPSDRLGMWSFARAVLGSSDWYASLWDQRDRIKDLPVLLLWGMKDPAFGPRFLARWQSFLTNAQTIAYPRVGHFVPDEAGEAASSAIEAFLQTS